MRRGEAFTLVSPEEESDLRAIEKSIGKSLPRRKVADFNYSHTPVERFEVPIGERIAAIRARKADDRARSKAKATRREKAGHPAKDARPAGRSGSSKRRGR